jgi:hypothetical protein
VFRVSYREGVGRYLGSLGSSGRGFRAVIAGFMLG